MSWQTSLRAHLIAQANLTALVGHRIYRTVAPAQTVTPYIVWQQITSTEGTTWNGEGNPSFPIVQFTAWADDTLKADEIRDILRDAIEGEEIGGSAFTIRDFQDLDDTSGPKTLYGALIETRAHG